jgi:hypothetical protein
MTAHGHIKCSDLGDGGRELQMTVGVIGTCTAPGVGQSLQELLRDDEVFHFEAVDVLRTNRADTVANLLADCKIVFSHYLPPEYGPLSTDVLRRSHNGFRIMPNLVFTGFHPDCVYLNGESPLAPYHSAIAAASFALGLNLERAIELYNYNVFNELGYFDEFRKASIFLSRHFSDTGLDITAEWRTWMSSAPFMHTINHPKGFVMASMAKLLAIKAGLLAEPVAVQGTVPDPLAGDHARWPVYPEIAGMLGITGDYQFYKPNEGGVLGLEDFVDVSFSLYRNLPVDVFEPVVHIGAVLSQVA